ncbi:MAG: 30S ribosomal protein S4 [Deltaproteobacteria bacterium RIFCSPHIGHO2_02_FULL_40_11]|nr:MAG: 30S ribosomal protein S4 [Deltaproteobacteria bacterium RIFCSPHIGHO2_02_FULL_40_11]
MLAHGNSVCTTCRRENLKLFLKGDRCFTEKCSFERRSYPPGQHGQGRTKFSEYALQLREKQKVRRLYGLLEGQFESIAQKASKQQGVTGEVLLSSLESRMDSVIYQMGYAESRNQARQLIRHKHFTLNGKRMDSPSHQVKEGDLVEVKEKSRELKPILAAIEAVKRREIPAWLEVDPKSFKGTIKRSPKREDITVPIQENLIVEYYSR